MTNESGAAPLIFANAPQPSGVIKGVRIAVKIPVMDIGSKIIIKKKHPVLLVGKEDAATTRIRAVKDSPVCSGLILPGSPVALKESMDRP